MSLHDVSPTFLAELRLYLGVDDELAATLRELHPIVEPHMNHVVSLFYEAVLAHRATRSVLEDEKQVERLRVSLRAWLEDVFEAGHSDEALAARFRIGRRHVEVGLLPHFMFTAMNVVRRALNNIILDQGTEHTRRYCDAVSRALDLDLTIMVQSYWDVMLSQKLEAPAALAGGMAHEIRNPLNTIALNITLLERRLNGGHTERVAEILDAIRAEVTRMQQLTTEIVNFTRPIDINPQWLGASDFLHRLESVHAARMDEADIELTCTVQGGGWIWADEARLEQVFSNLIANAVDAAPGGHIRIDLHDTNRHWTTIVVADNGSGMDPALRDHVFDIFFTNKAAGTGLGLPIVRSIIESHGGIIEVRSQPGKGTRFTISLPRPEDTP